jgi:ABC-2 type transport system permease protein
MTEAPNNRPGRSASGPARPSTWNSITALFSATFARQIRSRRTLVLGLLYALPIVLAVLIRRSGAGWRGPTSGYEPRFAEFILIFNLIPQVFIPLTALVLASGMIQDEVEDQTITYLLIRPLPRWSIYAAKLLATLLAAILLTAAGTALTSLAIGWGLADHWEAAGGGLARTVKAIALFALDLTAYCALFGLLSLLMRRSVLLGIGYIILLEGVVANIDFVIRKGTVMYYYRVLCERWIELGQADKFNIDLATAPGLGQSVAILLGASTVAAILASLLMGSREFRVKSPEGS